jgi:hypothetical protein
MTALTNNKKHNKKRNTLFLMEALVCELTSAALKTDNEKYQKIRKLIKEHFSPTKLLGKEYRIYKSVSSTVGYPRELAEKILKEAKSQLRKLDRRELFKEQTCLLGEINKTIGQDVYLNYVPNYKDIATLHLVLTENLDPKQRTLLENHIVNKMSKREVEEKSEIQPEQLNSLVIRRFTENFNTTYGELLTEQKTLLNKYVLSKFDEAGYVIFVNEELGRLKEGLARHKDNVEFGESIGQTFAILESFSRKRELTTEDLENVLATQELLKELEENSDAADSDKD